jgi:hypothetical protein
VFLVILVWTVIAVDIAVGIGGSGEALQLVSFGIRAPVIWSGSEICIIINN